MPPSEAEPPDGAVAGCPHPVYGAPRAADGRSGEERHGERRVSSRRQIGEHLAAVPLFASCSKRDRSTIARHTEEVELPAGTPIIKEGEPGDAFYVLVEGAATISRRGRTVRRAGPGDWFGELALLDSAPRNATVVADTEVALAVLGARIFSVLLKEMPSMSDKLLRGLARRLREADERSVQ